jgi:hypothetical protein
MSLFSRGGLRRAAIYSNPISGSFGLARKLMERGGGKGRTPADLSGQLETQASNAGAREQQTAARRNQLLQTADIALGDDSQEQQLYEDELGSAIGGINAEAGQAQRDVSLGAVQRGKKGSSTELEAQAGVKNMQAEAVTNAVTTARAALFNRQTTRRNTLAQIRASILSGDSVARQATAAQGDVYRAQAGGATQATIDRDNYTSAMNRIGDARSQLLGGMFSSVAPAAGGLAKGAA